MDSASSGAALTASSASSSTARINSVPPGELFDPSQLRGELGFQGIVWRLAADALEVREAGPLALGSYAETDIHRQPPSIGHLHGDLEPLALALEDFDGIVSSRNPATTIWL
jgi:hypothetical protein